MLVGSDAPSLQVPDGFDIFSAQFSRDGDDLVIAANGSPPLTVIDYFTLDSPPGLAMPNGAMLTGDVVELLAGPRAPGQYAQADGPEGAESIGQVETMTGTSTATRVSGETVELGQGDPVFQGDVIQTGSDSTLGLRLEDGTLASMSAQSRLVLNEFVYETGGSDNWMLVNLVEGAFAFLTGAIAPSGGMEITTPVAVMAIRGTMPVAFVADSGASQFFAASDKDYDLLHLTTREILAVVSSEAGFSLSSPDAPLETIELDPETLDAIEGLLDVLNDAAAELGLLGIQDGSTFHSFSSSSFGSIDGGNVSTTLLEFLVLLEVALTEEAVVSVQASETFLAAETELIATPDLALTDEMNSVVINVLDNDSHPDNSDLTVVFADVPNGQGSVTIVDGQYVVFDPGADFDYLALGETADVIITYVVADSTGAIASSTATVTLTGINQAPVIAPVGETSLDEQTDTQPLEATIAVTFNDVDLNNVGHEAAVVGVAVSGEAGGLTLDDAALMALVSPGTVIKNAGDSTGFVNFDFTAASSVFDYLADGVFVTLTYTFEIDDGDGGTIQQTFDVTMTGTNDMPVIGGVSSAAVTEDATTPNLTAGGVLTIADVDQGQSNFAPQASFAGTYGTFTLAADGTWTYTADNSQAAIQQLGATQSIQDSFIAVSSDGTASQLVTVTINGTNDVPVIGGDVTGSVTEDVDAVDDELTADGTLTIVDADAGQSSFVPQANVAGSNGFGSFTLLANGSWSYSADNTQAAIQELGEGETLTDSFTAVSLDGTEEVVTVTIHGTNDIPVLVSSTDTLLDEQGLDEAAVVDTGEIVVDFGPELPDDLVGAFSFKTDDLDGQLETTAGTPVTFAIAENGDLVGSAGGGEVIRIAITDASGAGSEVTYTYEVTLSESLMHTGPGTDSAFLSGVGFVVQDSNGDPVEGSFDVEVIDDVPVATDDDSNVMVGAANFNIAFVLDFSGSVGFTDFNTMLDAVTDAGQAFFDSAGDVSITLVRFASGANTIGTYDNFQDFAAALDISAFNRGIPTFATNYTAAIEETMDSYSPVVGEVNQVFFVSDGEPNQDMGSGHALTSDTREDWNSFVATNDITVQTIGVGAGADEDSLQDVDEADGNNDVIFVTEFEGLVDSLLELVNRVEVSGNVLDNDGFGADGPGHVASLSVGDNTYVFDGSDVTIPDDATGSAVGSVLTVATGLGAMLTFDFATGGFSYVTTTSGTGTEAFAYTIADGDDDTASATLTVTVEEEGAGQFSASAFTAGSEDQMMQMLSSDLDGSSGSQDGFQVHTITDLTMDDVIIDYLEGDVIDLTQLGFELATGQLNAEAAGEYVDYDQADGVLSVDMDGAGKNADFEDIAQLVTQPPSILVRLSDGDTTADIQVA